MRRRRLTNTAYLSEREGNRLSSRESLSSSLLRLFVVLIRGGLISNQRESLLQTGISTGRWERLSTPSLSLPRLAPASSGKKTPKR